ncbi:unnamed protein product [Urochloa humidicola]
MPGQHLAGQGQGNENVEGNFIGAQPQADPQPAVMQPVLQEIPLQDQNVALGMDLNLPMEEDPEEDEEVDEIIQIDEMVEENDPQGQQANIIEGSTSSDSEQHQHVLPDLNEAYEVQVFIPLEDGVPLQVMPDEIQEEDLPQNPFPQENGSPNNNHELLNQEMQLGFVQLIQPYRDPVFGDKQLQFLINPYPSPFKHNAEATREWARYLAPRLGADAVAVPKNWADFFTAMLMHPRSFMWAKSFLSSQALTALHHQNEEVVHFSIPDKCPHSEPLPCLEHLPSEASLEEDLERLDKGKEPLEDPPSPCTPPDQRGIKISPSTGPWSHALLAQAVSTKKNQALVESEVRRSNRRKDQLGGFRRHTCMNKNCLGCSKEPPQLSPSVIKNLGYTFCKLDEAKLTKEALNKKRKVPVAAPSGKKLPISKTSKKYDNDDQKKKKPQKKQPKI